MHHKNIKAIINKQLKKHYPNLNRLKKKLKKEIAKETLVEAVAKYDFDQITPDKRVIGHRRATTEWSYQT